MSLSKHRSLGEALAERPESNANPIVSHQVLESGEDFIVTCISETKTTDKGFVQLDLDEKLFENCLSRESDLNSAQVTEFAQRIKTQELGDGLLGCQREVLGRTKVGEVLGDSNLCIGDVSITKFVKNKGFLDFFDLIQTKSILSKEALGQDIGGFTHSTIQISGGPCVLPFHIEHWGVASVNVHHWGANKIWYIISPSYYLPALLNMEKLQGSANLGEYGGVCQSTLTHRDVFVEATRLSIPVHVVEQKPGQVMFIAPFALHSVQNKGTNCAASMNFMPPDLVVQCAAYNTCLHSEGLGGKPLFNKMTAMIENLYRQGEIELKDYIHDSDPNKEYKLRVVEKLKKEGNENILQEVIQHIKWNATTPYWFNYILRKEEQLTAVVDSDDKSVSTKYFSCPVCDYSTNHHNDLGKHIQRIHGEQVKVPPNTNQVKCPDCGKVLKCLRKHKDLKRCKKRKRED
jgi:hypothetical protein